MGLASSVDSSKQIARLLLESGAVHFDVNRMFRYVSGIQSPIYIDNRKVISFPKERRVIVDHFVDVLRNQVEISNIDVVAGTATAGIPWAAWIAADLDMPLIYVRPSPKDRGLEKQIEGVLLPEQRVVVIEDLITTGLSSSNVAHAIKNKGGIVDHCIAIFSFGLPIAEEKFSSMKLSLRSLTTLTYLIEVSRESGYLSDSELRKVEQWSLTGLAEM